MAPRNNTGGNAPAVRKSSRISSRQNPAAANSPVAQADSTASSSAASAQVPPQAPNQSSADPANPPAATKSTASNVTQAAIPAATPRNAKVSAFNFHHKKRGYYTRAVNQEMDKAYVQVGVEDFFRLCMSGPSTISLAAAKLQLPEYLNFDDVPTGEREKEVGMYAPLCSTIHGLFMKLRGDNKLGIRLRTSELTIKETANHKETKAPEVDLMPDLSLFDSQIKPAVRSFESNVEDSKRAKKAEKVEDGARESFVGRTAWAWVVSFIEAKNDSEAMPFELEEDAGDFTKGLGADSTGRGATEVHVTAPRVTDTPLGRRARSQIIKYVSEIQLRQHRNFVLCAHICRSYIRFMRWDRTGAIVSKAVNYKRFPLVLLDFLCRLATTDGTGRGYDPSAQLVHEPRRTLEDFVKRKKGKWEASYAADMAADTIGFPIYEIICPGIDAGQPLTLWIGRHWSGSRSPTGRGSKAYVAFDVTNDRLVFLKDYWCARHPTIHPELETYEKFRAAERTPRYVAHALGGGPVLLEDAEQVTLTQRFLERIWALSSVPLERFHYRLVLQEVGRPLDTFKDSENLIDLIYEAFLAHKQAWTQAGVLHRDISPGNIVIDQSGHALLVDWDLCKYKEELGQPASQHGRSGTWPFMSGALLKYPLKPHELADDLESFVHVLCFMALRYQAHSHSPGGRANSENLGLAQLLKSVFFEASIHGHFTVGGFRKCGNITDGRPDFVLKNNQGPLATLIQEFYHILNEHYGASNWDAWLAVMPTQNDIPPTQPPRIDKVSEFDDDDDDDDDDVAPPFGFTPPLLPVRATRAQASSIAGTGAQELPPPAAVMLPLANHRAMQLAFKRVLKLPIYNNDKTPDQFSGLPDPDAITPGLTGQLICEDTMSGSSKDVSRGSADVL